MVRAVEPKDVIYPTDGVLSVSRFPLLLLLLSRSCAFALSASSNTAINPIMRLLYLLGQALLLSLTLSVGVLAQYSSVTNVCNITGWSVNAALPVSVISASTFYVEGTIANLAEFEYRLIALDGRPLGFLELYDFDEGDDDGINFSCFVQQTIDTSTCPNQYIANGQTILIGTSRLLRFGFQRCAEYDPTVHSLSMTLGVYYRPMVPTPEPPTCTTLTIVSAPTTFCAKG